MSNHSPHKLKILFVTSEAAPYAKSGGLGSVMQALPCALRKLGHDARVMMPRYLTIDPKQYRLKMERQSLRVPTDNSDDPTHLICNVKSRHLNSNGIYHLPIYFLENQEYYEQRANVYGYADDPVRWALLCRGTLTFLQEDKRWTPDVIITADWMTGYLANYLKTIYRQDPILSKIAVVFSIHNLAYQGVFRHRYIQESDFDDGHSPIPALNDPRLLKINAMRRGIMYADIINTVSPTYAKEITTEEHGELLHELLKEKRSLLYGILNGIDYKIWDPRKDPLLPHHFSSKRISERVKNRIALQERFGLTIDDKALLMGIVSRLSRQKGFDLLTSITPALFRELNVQLIVVGEGDTDLMKFFHDLEDQHPQRVSVHLQMDSTLPHLVYAGADITLVPSRFEPSGLIQMEAMRYGSIPVIRRTGGLADTVEDYNPRENVGTGFTFQEYDPSSLLIAIVRAYVNKRHKKIWQDMQKRAMEKDFSWDLSAKKYEDLFYRAIEIKSRQNAAE